MPRAAIRTISMPRGDEAAATMMPHRAATVGEVVGPVEVRPVPPVVDIAAIHDAESEHHHARGRDRRAPVSRGVSSDDHVRRRVVHAHVGHVVQRKIRWNVVDRRRHELRHHPRPRRRARHEPHRIAAAVVLAADEKDIERRVRRVAHGGLRDRPEIGIAVVGDFDRDLVAIDLRLLRNRCEHRGRVRLVGPRHRRQQIARVGILGNPLELRGKRLARLTPRATKRVRAEPPPGCEQVVLLAASVVDDVVLGVGRKQETRGRDHLEHRLALGHDQLRRLGDHVDDGHGLGNARGQRFRDIAPVGVLRKPRDRRRDRGSAGPRTTLKVVGREPRAVVEKVVAPRSRLEEHVPVRVDREEQVGLPA